MELQVLDLNWGIPQELIGHQTDMTSLSIQEIQRSLALSSGPNFIAFLGQKYGPLSLPDVILSEEFEAIMLALYGHKGRDTRKADMLERLYDLDDNNIPPVYVLKEKCQIVPELSSSDSSEREVGGAKWEELQTELRALLHKGVELAHLNGSLDSETRDRYLASDLENLTCLGFDSNDDTSKRCVLITRTIADLKNYSQEPRAQYFADVTYNDMEERLELDQVSAEKLDRLKKNLHARIPDSTRIHWEVLWRYEEVIHPQLHKEYLLTLCQQLYEVCVGLIDEDIPVPELTTGHGVYDEAVQHWSRCRYTAATCMYNQDTLLNRLREYLVGNLTTPLVVYGAPGSGKSKMISKMAFHISELLTGEYIFILRYIGHTPKANDLRQLLVSICQQIALTTDRPEEEVPLELKEVIKYFQRLLASIPSNIRLVIILDGLEQLHSDSHSLILNWVPCTLPPHVKLIMSINSTARDLLEQFTQDVLPENPESFLEMVSATVDECEDMLSQLLISVDRSVTNTQMAVLKRVIEGEPLPLYVELLANLAKDWNSFTDVSSVYIPLNCEDGIRDLLDRLEKKHGYMMVSRALSYIVASSSGLSDCEMEDVLSLDEDLLNEIYQDFHPTVRRVPPMKWLMLKRDIESFLSYRESDGVTVTTWQHESFNHAINSRYLCNDATFTLVHSNLADYFLGTWSARTKPAYLENGKKLPGNATISDRKVPSQPHTFGESKDGLMRFNKRMYNQVPRHLHLSGRYKELNNLAFFNYEWLYSKTRALSLQHVMDDFELNPIEEVGFVEEALRVSKHIIEDDVNSLPIEITGHLLPYYASHSNIRSLIRQCDTDGLQQCALVPNFPYHHVPGTSLEYTLECPNVTEDILYLHDGRHLACKRKDDPYIHRFDLKSGDAVKPVFVSIGELYLTPDNKYFIIVDHVTEKAIKIHEAETGTFLKQIILLNHIQGKTSLYKKGPLSLNNTHLCAVVTLANSVLCICNIPSGEVVHVLPLEGKAHVCQISPDGRRVFCNANAFLLSIDLITLQPLLNIPIGSQPNNIVLTQDGLRGYLSNDLDTRLTVMHMNGDHVDMIYRAVLEDKMPGDCIQKLSVSQDDELILVRGLNNLLVYHRGSEKIMASLPRPLDVPEEFKLPKSHYVKLNFTNAELTPDSSFIIGTVFRNIYLWQISSGSLIATIQTPIGVIIKLEVSSVRSQVITHIDGSRDIQVWNISEALRQVTTRDKLTEAISEFQVTVNTDIAFVRCEKSDELGVIDMRNGCLLDLLTHDMPIQDFAASPGGDWVLVSTHPGMKNTAFKLWNIRERKVALEIGNVSGYCVSFKAQPKIFMIAPKIDSFKPPQHISAISFSGGEFYEHGYPHQITVIKSKPFITMNDKYLVVSSSLDDKDANSNFSTSCICAFDIDNDMHMSVTDAAAMKFEEHLLDILDVKPCHGNTVAAVFSCKSHKESLSGRQDFYEPETHTFGCFFLDASKGTMTLLCIPFPKPNFQVGSNPLIFNTDCTLCIDEQGQIFHTPTGKFICQVQTPASSPPRAFALRSTVIVTFLGTYLYVTRIYDGVTLGQCDVHSPICHLHVCADDRTLLVGCSDGTVLSYTIIDPERDNPTSVLSVLPSRKVGDQSIFEKRFSRSWDKINSDNGPSYSRPPSATDVSTNNKQLIAQLKTKSWTRPPSAVMPRTTVHSQMCRLM
uniref:Uncharacterized protein n=1 Tax=Biomphalaria glabrata TaxID=6526 RepID=A0A2C9JHY2_BIOGL